MSETRIRKDETGCPDELPLLAANHRGVRIHRARKMVRPQQVYVGERQARLHIRQNASVPAGQPTRPEAADDLVAQDVLREVIADAPDVQPPQPRGLSLDALDEPHPVTEAAADVGARGAFEQLPRFLDFGQRARERLTWKHLESLGERNLFVRELHPGHD
jgi:hypothetical protein